MTFPLNLTVFSLNFSHYKNWALTVDTSHPNDDGMYDVTFKVCTTDIYMLHHTHTYTTPTAHEEKQQAREGGGGGGYQHSVLTNAPQL